MFVIARVNRKEFTAKLKPEEIDYKRLDVLSRFLTPIGKIEPARRTGASRTQQTRIARAINRARRRSPIKRTDELAAVVRAAAPAARADRGRWWPSICC